LNGDVLRLPAFVIDAVDTTGSGDAFSAGILVSWLNHSPLAEMCMLANSLGAYAATQLGPVSTRLDIKSLVEFLKTIRSSQSPGMQQAIDHFLDNSLLFSN
jgi:sugar/nucleoside kinase (ribokinase family)